MSRFGDNTNPQRVGYLQLHGLKPTKVGDPAVWYFDSLAPFKPAPNEDVLESVYLGKIDDGPFMNFNLFLDSRIGYFIVVFGRTCPIKGTFEHLCDKGKNWQMVKCAICGEETSVEDGESWFDCSGCETYTQNPNFKSLDGNPEYELL